VAVEYLRQGELFSSGADVPTQRDIKVDYRLVDTQAKFTEFYQQLRKQKRFAVDLETTSVDPVRSQIVGLAFSWQAGEAWYLPLRGPEGEAKLDPDTTLARLADVLEDPNVAKV